MTLVRDQGVAYNRRSDSDVRGYEQLLRAVGQALEKHNFQSFEMTAVGDEFRIRSTAAAVVEEHLADRGTSRIPSFLDRFPNRSDGGGHIPQTAESSKSPVELQFTLQDIQQLESEGRARRTDGQQMANASSLSQVLRCLGAYLNQKRARLLKLTRDGEAVLIEYESSLGSQMKESFSAKGLYDMWVRMYLQRAGRSANKAAPLQSG